MQFTKYAKVKKKKTQSFKDLWVGTIYKYWKILTIKFNSENDVVILAMLRQV